MTKLQIANPIKQVWPRLKPHLRWVILGGTLFFLAKALKDHATEVAALRINSGGWATLAIAFCVTLLAHVWSGWVWNWIFWELKQPIKGAWGIPVYLKTNIAKYLPGNVWHFYGRILAAKAVGVSTEAATVSVLLEPLLMAAAALIVALISVQFAGAHKFLGWQVLGLVTVLVAVHPRSINPAIQFLGRAKKKATGSTNVDAKAFRIQRYPLVPMLGELCFVGLRGAGFLLTMHALSPIDPGNIPLLLGAFSLAWLLGLIIPGAPGGLGVFEATALTVLDGRFSPALMLGTVALYRLISILAEVAGAGLASLYELLALRDRKFNL